MDSSLLSIFHSRWPCKCSEDSFFLSTAPGRVNLIGEHVDHQDYSVLPCTIEKNIKALAHISTSPVSSEDISAGFLEIQHEDPSKYPSKRFKCVSDLVVESPPVWTNYIVAAFFGVAEYLVFKHADKVGTCIDPKLGVRSCPEILAKLPNLRMKILVTGSIPEAAGLSSSSALVVCTAQVFSRALFGELAGAKITASEIATMCSKSERYVGTAGGGMDQAAICLSQPGQMSHIGFNPLTIEPVILPSDLMIVVSNSGREAPKARDAAKMYNKRVFELKTACLMMLSRFEQDKARTLSGEDTLKLTVRQIVRQVMAVSEQEALTKLADLVPDKAYTKADIDHILQPAQKQYLLEKRCGVSVWEQNDEFFLYKRVRHVLNETIRVDKFVALCESAASQPGKRDLSAFGKLVAESGDSLADDFECSCQEVEDLRKICHTAGSLGSRVCGAGWGGCVISLIRKSDHQTFVEKVAEAYFRPYLEGGKVASPPLEQLPATMAELGVALFATSPSGPASCYRLPSKDGSLSSMPTASEEVQMKSKPTASV